jgi:hypothetical protein
MKKYKFNEKFETDFNFNDLMGAARYIAINDVRTIEHIFAKSGYLEMKYLTSKFLYYRFTENVIDAVHEVTFEDNEGNVDKGFIHITWDGKEFEASV